MVQLTQARLQKSIHAALRAYNTLSGTADNFLSTLLLVKNQLAKSDAHSATARRLATNNVLNDALETLHMQDPEGARILRLRFVQREIAGRVRYIMGLSEDQVKRRQRDAIQNLTQIILGREMQLRQQQIDHLESQLPPSTYNDLFGINEKLGQLQQHLLDPNGYWLVALVGIGGIGKTALAHCLTRLVMERLFFERIIWIRVDGEEAGGTAVSTWQTILNQLITHLCPNMDTSSPLILQTEIKKQLKQIPTLIVIDNLESSAINALLAEQLPTFSNPSKFLFTSRVQFPLTAPILTVQLNELTETPTYQLLRSLAQEKGIIDLMQADDETLHPIYQVTGGNPLAIKIVCGLALNMPLSDILADFKRVHTLEVDELYKHIYWKSWQQLDESSQILLEMMPLASDKGMTPEQISAATGLEENQIWPSINRLVNQSLLEARGSLWERRYGVHQLTASFLRTEVIQLPTTPQQFDGKAT